MQWAAVRTTSGAMSTALHASSPSGRGIPTTAIAGTVDTSTSSPPTIAPDVAPTPASRSAEHAATTVTTTSHHDARARLMLQASPNRPPSGGPLAHSGCHLQALLQLAPTREAAAAVAGDVA